MGILWKNGGIGENGKNRAVRRNQEDAGKRDGKGTGHCVAVFARGGKAWIKKEPGTLTVLGHFFCDLVEQFPLLCAELADDRDKTLSRRIVRVSDDLTEKFGKLLIARELLEHIAIAGTEPMLVNVKLTANQFDKRIVWCCLTALEICDNASSGAEVLGKIGLG